MATITFHESQISSDVLVFAEGDGMVGRIRPVGSAFRVLDGRGTQLALRRTMRQAENDFRYGFRIVR